MGWPAAVRAPLCAVGSALAAWGQSAWAEPTVQLLRCDRPGGVTVGVIHRGGQPLAVTLGVVAGARDCGTRSNQPPRRDGAGWRFEWMDDAVGAQFAAELTPWPGGGFRLRLSEPDASGDAPSGASATVACGSLALPVESLLEPEPRDARCTTREDRSEALQAAWQALRGALLQRDPERLRTVLAPQVRLGDGAAGDGERVSAAQVAQHLACVADLNERGQTFADWARERPSLLAEPPGVERLGDGSVRLARFAGLDWRDGRWQLSWVAGQPAMLLRDCAWPAR